MKVNKTMLVALLLVLPLSAQAPTVDPLVRWMDKSAQS